MECVKGIFWSLLLAFILVMAAIGTYNLFTKNAYCIHTNHGLTTICTFEGKRHIYEGEK